MVTNANCQGIRRRRNELDGKVRMIRIPGVWAESDERPFAHRDGLAVLVEQFDVHIATDLSALHPTLGDHTLDRDSAFGSCLDNVDELEISAVVDVKPKRGIDGDREGGDQREQSG
jgi:hypothetical protein